MENSRLLTLDKQSKAWQHQHSKNPKPQPYFKKLCVDHPHGQIFGARALSGMNTQLTGSLPRFGGFPPLVTPGASPHEMFHTHPHTSYSSDDLPNTFVARLCYRSSVKSMDFHPVHQTLLLVGTDTGDIVLRGVGDWQNIWPCKNFCVYSHWPCSESLLISLANNPTVSVNRVTWNPAGTVFGVAYSMNIVHVYSYHGAYNFRIQLQIDAHVGYVSDLAFSYPDKQLCIVTCGEDKAIRVWDAVTGAPQYNFEGHEDPVYSVCTYHKENIKVWDAVTGAPQYNFEGHEAPVYSVCTYHKENIKFIFSNSVDGKIKAWQYGFERARANVDAPGLSCTRMASSADGTRLFSCGTSKAGESHIVEWDVTNGVVKRSYVGLGKRTTGVVQFDTTKNRFLAAADELCIKFWGTENVNILTTTNANSGLLASPCIRFSKEGVLLAVSASNNSVIILGNAEGYHLVRTVSDLTLDHYRVIASNVEKSHVMGVYGAPGLSAAKKHGVLERDAPGAAIAPLNGDSRTWPVVNDRMTGEMKKSRVWKPVEINKQSQLRCLRLPDTLLLTQITRLIYTNSGGAILALACNGMHKLWKWHKDEHNRDGKATVNVLPELWLPASGRLMTNDLSETNLENAVSCLAITKDDLYVISGSGGKISMFEMKTFKTRIMFMPPPPAVTLFALHPQEINILAFGMEDSSIQIYNIKSTEVIGKLEGHQDRVTGLAFSLILEALVSSGADGQICVWSINGWNKQASKSMHVSSGRSPNPPGQNHVQFHQDQTQLLVFNENLIAIYEAPELKCINQWLPENSSGSITSAVYSCDSQSVYAAFESGNIIVFSAALSPRCEISPKAYFTASPSTRVYPLAITAHPNDPDQFAAGLGDGFVQVLEPLESERWGTIKIP